MQQQSLQSQSLPKKTFGNTNQQVSNIGLGCAGLSQFYSVKDFTEEQGLEIIKSAIEKGINHFDSAYVYGKNEELLAQAIKRNGRDKFFLASKAPFMDFTNGQSIPRTKENIKKYCYESLQRLQVDYIDIYYQHRIDPEIPIEEQAEAFKELIQEGKIRYYGLCEASEDSIRRAHKVHPITAIQEEYSLFSRNIEFNGVKKTCEELGIALVAYSPLGIGMLTGAYQNTNKFDDNDIRRTFPRFEEENMKKNLIKVEQLKEHAKKLGYTPGQVALSWLLNKSQSVFPIPGTKKEKYLIENVNAGKITLSKETMEFLENLFPQNALTGQRFDDNFMKLNNTTTVKK